MFTRIIAIQATPIEEIMTPETEDPGVVLVSVAMKDPVMLEDGDFGLELLEEVNVDWRVVMMLGGGLELVVTVRGIGTVVFRAGHPEDSASRRTAHLICRESIPFQTTAG